MPCDSPLHAYRPAQGSADRRLVFQKNKSETGVAIQVPCGKCSGCRLEHSRQWAVRCMHEKRMHNEAAFLTLTYSDDNLPALRSLVKSDLQNFMKRIRDHFGWYAVGKPDEPGYIPGVRFFACGEYGEKTLRPHYHVLLLNHDLPDRKFFTMSGENKLYTSQILDDIWGNGHCNIGDVTFDSAAYVARYCMKKITGPPAEAHYAGRVPEFITMSRRPGLGSGYFARYRNELLDHDTIIVNGVEAALPRYYDGRIDDLLPDEIPGRLMSPMEEIKARRRAKITLAMKKDMSSNRRRVVRETVRLAKLNLKRRIL